MSPLLRAWGPAVACAAAIFLASSRPSLPVDLELGLDKVAHFGVYAVLGLALGRARVHHRWPVVAALAIGLLYAFSDELHQSLVPGRAPEVADWVADALGTLAGLLVHTRWHRARTRTSGPPARAASSPSPS